MKSLLKRKKLIFITGDRKKEASSVVKFVCKHDFSVFYTNKKPGILDIFKIMKSEVVIFEDNEKNNAEEVADFLSLLPRAVFVVTETEKKARTEKFLRLLPEEWLFIVDFSIAKKLKSKKGQKTLTFGINKKSAGFFITDIHQKENEINFKVNYSSNSIPFWIKGKLKRKEIYGVLPALCVAEILSLNLAEVSLKLKEKFKSFTNE